MVIVHHLEDSRSQRVLWLLEELGADYEVRRYDRDPETSLAPPELYDIHPLGKSPVITDGDVTVAETGAIFEYLIETYDPEGRLKPQAGSQAARDYTYWLHYAEGSFMPLMIVSLIMSRIEAAPLPFFAKPIARGIVNKVRESYLDPNVRRHLDYLNDQLADKEWFLGNRLSAADIQMSFAIEAAEVRSDLPERYPNLNGYLARMRARPAYQAALQRGGPYSLGA